MKKLLTPFIILVLCLGLTCKISAQKIISFTNDRTTKSNPSKKVIDNENFVEIEYNIPSAILIKKEANGKEYSIFNIKSFGHAGEIGSPMLPSRNDIVALPNVNIGVKNIVILNAEYIEYSGYLMHPMLKPASDSKGAAEPEFILNQEAYDLNAFMPAKIAEVADVQIMKDVPLGFIQINPVQYNPVTGIIRVYSKFKIRIEYTGASKGVKNVANQHTEKSLNAVRRLVVNPNLIPKSSKSKAEAFDGRKDYIIITHEAFLSAAKKLANWKRQMGFSVEVVSKNRWTSEMVDMEIKDRYESWTPKPEYFVIIGDHDGEYAVPGKLMTEFKTYTTPASEPFCSDNPYSCMDGANDYIPDMARGRLSVRTTEQANIVVDRIIDYEKAPPQASSYYNTTLNCAYFQHASNGYAERRFCQTSEEIRNHMLEQEYSVNRVYSTNAKDPKYWNKGSYSNGEPIPTELHKPNFPWVGEGEGEDQIIDEFNAGRFLIFHRDHGYTGGRGWADPYFTLESIDKLTNKDKLPVVFSINCHTGQFIENECFAEKLQRSSNGGAVGVFAAGQSSYSGSNDALVLNFYDAIWPGVVLNFTGSGGENVASPATSATYTMGNVLNYGLVRMNETWPRGTEINGQSSYQCMLYHYFGDPAMQIRTKAPKNLSATLPYSVSCDATSISISNCNTSNAIVTLTMGGKLIAKAQLSSGSGTLNFTALGNNPNGAVITVSASNSIPKIQSISITGTCNYKPVAEFTPSAYTTMSEELVKLTDESKYNPSNWEWTISPNDVKYLNGTNANSQNPELEFSKSGTYSVTLKVTNINGSNTINKSDYITATTATPKSFKASTVPGNSINLSWTKQSGSQNVVVVYNLDGVFGSPKNGTTYTQGSIISEGDKVAYVGNTNSFIHTELIQGTPYYYKIWSISPNNTYSLLGAKAEGITANNLAFPYEEGFENTNGTALPNGWASENNANGKWYTSYPNIAGRNSLVHTFDANAPNKVVDGWAFSAPLELKAGNEYEIRFKYTTATDYLKASLELKFGKSQSSNGMTSDVLFSDIDFGYKTPQQVLVNITVNETGIYYLGFHEEYQEAYKLSIDDIIVRNLTEGHPGYWDGKGSTDWSLASNWSQKVVPDANTNVTLPEWCTSYPIINGNATCKNLFIQNGSETKLTVNNGGNLNITGDLWVGNGIAGEFEMNGGTVTTNYLCTHLNSLTDINNGTLVIKESWVRKPDRGWHFIRGNIELSGGEIDVAKSVCFGGRQFNGVVDGPVYMRVGEDFRNDDRLFKATSGTLELTGSAGKVSNTCYGSNDECFWIFYNLIINGEQTREFRFNAPGPYNLKVVNDLTIESGDMHVGASNVAALDTIHIGGNFRLKSGVTFDAWREVEFIVFGDLIIEPNVTLINPENIEVRGKTIYLGGNIAPTVEITSPANNMNFNANDDITISATASDSDGTISVVEFYQGTTKLGEDEISPYTYSWKNVAIGNYKITAKATDNGGSEVLSTEINIIVEEDGNNSSYCNIEVGSTGYEHIGRVQLGTIDQTSGSLGYSDYTSVSTNLYAGVATNLLVTTKSSYSDDKLVVYIDYNKNGKFTDSGEEVHYGDAASEKTYTIGITAPTIAIEGTTRMRIIVFDSGYHGKAPCGYVKYGEVEDYTLNIVSDGGVDTEAPTIPSNLSYSNVTKNSVDLSWTASTDNTAVTSYDIYNGGTLTKTVKETSASISGLTANTSYTFTIKAKDAAENVSEASNALTFITENEGGEQTYCEAKSTSNAYEYISNVKFGNLDKSSNSEGYQDFTSETISIAAGATTELSITLASKYSADELVVYIDYNNDGKFTGSNEEVYYNSDAGDNTTNVANITIPNSAVITKTRMRVILFDSGNNTKAPCGNYSYGEVEDYSVNITAKIDQSIASIKALNKGEFEAVLIPNPASGYFMAKLINVENATLQLIGLNGVIIKHKAITNTNGKVDISNTPSG